MQLSLVPRLVPRPLWGRSGAQLLDDEVWRAIRAEVVADADSTCVVCGHRQRRWMVCDEDWRYAPDSASAEAAGGGLPTSGVALLAGLRLLCPRCDRVVHLGYTESQHGRDGAAAALRHAATVNGVTVTDMKMLAEVSFERWAQLSSIRRWQVVVDPPLAERFPALRVVELHAGG